MKKPKKLSKNQEKVLALAQQDGLMRLSKDEGAGFRWQTTNGKHVNRRTADILISRGLLKPNGDGLFDCMTQTFGANNAVAS